MGDIILFTISELAGDIDSIYFGVHQEPTGFDEIGVKPENARLAVLLGDGEKSDMLLISTETEKRIFEVEEMDMNTDRGVAVSRFRLVVNELKNKAHDGSAFVSEHESEIKTTAVVGGIVLAGIAGSIAVIRRKRAK